MYGSAGQQVCSTKSAQSTVSQSDADVKAYAAALADAQAQLNCQQSYTSTQQYTASCPSGRFGQPVTKSATYQSFISQQDADAQALALAKAAAESTVDCTGSNNTQKITINDLTFASPYPSVKYVSGLTGTITNVQVKINGFTHAYPSDVRFMLRAPDGTTCLLMQIRPSTSSPYGVSGINLTFDDGGSALPSNGQITAGTYAPSQYGVIPPMLAPAPGTPYGSTLSVFNGKDPNGSWALYVEDDKALDVGQVASGFDLVITTA